MALLAEEIVQEWLARQGFFCLRGVRLGVHEIDLLAVRFNPQGWECRHLEVQVSHRPASYLSRVPQATQRATNRKATSARKRELDELQQGVAEWVAKKFDHPEKSALRSRLAPGPWTREVVIHKLYEPLEKELLMQAGITVHQLSDVLGELRRPGTLVRAASGEALLNLIWAMQEEELDKAYSK
ncbi:hypothetical protein [Deinococcus wulumuqiensis]|uniref:hypothetical protein n=1 Tax=Deinococcus wulumuqiensis TaxID=980427 RepID=UPI001268F16D|nr:hypothetical protein [Deinococcus wulumuqiensis]QII19662.1 hypothetical protein G6R31_02035 [Deinococcus wulumuqiensis R12]